MASLERIAAQEYPSGLTGHTAPPPPVILGQHPHLNDGHPTVATISPQAHPIPAQVSERLFTVR
jgi:hypothetical protein